MGRLPRSARSELVRASSAGDAGRVPAPADRLAVEQRLAELVVHGRLAGSQALVGLLAQLDTLGLRVVSFRRVPWTAPRRNPSPGRPLDATTRSAAGCGSDGP